MLAFGGASLAALAARPAFSAVRIDITQGNVQPMPIALPDFVGGTAADGEVARSVTQIITNNLRRSGLFAPIDPAAYIEKIVNPDSVPRFPDWRAINAQALVTGRLTRQSDGRLKGEFRLWDVFAGQQQAGQQYFTTPDNWRRVGHIISDAIYERLPARRVISTRASSSLTKAARRSGASNVSRSWIRTAPMCAISRAATNWC